MIHESGNGTATPCTATPIDPTAQIVMASGHADSSSNLTYAQNQLYCNASPTGSQLPCPNPPNAIATAVDIVNFHMKPGNATGNYCPAPVPCTPETAIQTYVANALGILQPAELAKPMWDGEASYAEAGFTGAYADADMAASFMPRFYLMTWSLNVSGIAWYDWTDLTSHPAAVQNAYQQTYNWLSGSILTTPCAAVGTIYSCTINKSGTTVPRHVGFVAELRQRLLHHVESDRRIPVVAVPGYDHRKRSHLHLGAYRSARHQTGRAPLDRVGPLHRPKERRPHCRMRDLCWLLNSRARLSPCQPRSRA